jgi:hypothetical protein
MEDVVAHHRPSSVGRGTVEDLLLINDIATQREGRYNALTCCVGMLLISLFLFLFLLRWIY